jgi:hypothetical protein
MPAQRHRIMNEHLCLAEPRTDGEHHGPQERKCWLGRIQISEPSAQCGGIRHAIGIFSRWGRAFPGSPFHEIAVQRLATGDEAVVAVRRRERRQEGERLATSLANAAANPDPIMVLVMRLFAAAAMTDDGVFGADRAPAQDDLCAGFGPIGFGIDLIGGKWDKENRTQRGSARAGDLAKIGTRVEPLLPSKNLNWKRLTPSTGGHQYAPPADWPVNTNG